MKYSDGSIYKGNFYFGLKCNYGKLTYADGTYHEGKFSGDKIWNGVGTLKYANGSIYELKFRNGI